MKCTEPEYESGDFYVAHLEKNCLADETTSAVRPQLTVTRGYYDDFDPAIRFQGDWQQDTSFDGADRHTISYSDSAGAEVSIAFDGTVLIYVFTRAPNRGIADVVIDGADWGTVDLYAPGVEWQSRLKVCCNGPGKHMAVVRVTEGKNPRSSGRFVDLDSFEVW
jgi:hypothetical protein